MAFVFLVHPEDQIQISGLRLITKCTLFQSNLALAAAPYAIKSAVTVEVFRQFVAALEDSAIEITSANVTGLTLLSSEFGFESLSTRLSEFRSSLDCTTPGQTTDPQVWLRIAALEEGAMQRDRAIESLRTESQAQAEQTESAIARLSATIDAIRAELSAVRAAPRSAAPADTGAFQADISALKKWVLPRIDSVILSEWPEIFTEFRRKHFTLLWQGGLDGFGASEFHSRCDGHRNTLTLILDTDGNIFGGFTPVEWESREWSESPADDEKCLKGDPSLKSFLFTIKNPHKLPAKKFALRPECKEKALFCAASWGPCFNEDLTVSDACDSWTESSTANFGTCYTNNTGRYGDSVFTGSPHFTVEEIEVFQIID
jgi:hypothetical protein